jgi:hypothetical protein
VDGYKPLTSFCLLFPLIYTPPPSLSYLYGCNGYSSSIITQQLGLLGRDPSRGIPRGILPQNLARVEVHYNAARHARQFSEHQQYRRMSLLFDRPLPVFHRPIVDPMPLVLFPWPTTMTMIRGCLYGVTLNSEDPTRLTACFLFESVPR